ncbi:hypothetical protein SIO17_14605 [Pseudoalteromonas piscicida]|uniref:Restriction endonuclease n=1 Tax=Pseudoalteromonas piscicida TaxID=43662 RepID=A0ABM6NHB8_PSEO7|nr:hypothetical protein [Pseudoalteromonas piscicida]ATD08287.1 hypothetical protein PPIS_a3508 [Pseudoalteromonas piscicida]WPU30338.1 hypothetical protein SIO17_14605 [Pseudoalteromonas piscicida]
MQNSIFPQSNESFKEFISALNEKLIDGSNGQYRRKPTFLSAMVAESLPGKPDNYNINTLKAELKSNDVHSNQHRAGFLTFNSNTLLKVTNLGRELRKKEGIELEVAYRRAAERLALHNIEEIVYACRIPVRKHDFHRVCLDGLVFSLSVGIGYPNSNIRDLVITGYNSPSYCVHRATEYVLGSVSYGDMLKITYPSPLNRRDKDIDLFALHICKYSGGEPRIPLALLSKQVAYNLSEHLLIDFVTEDLSSPFEPYFKKITESELFLHLQEWAIRHPKTARNATSPYFENWGNLALDLPMKAALAVRK